MGDSRTAHVMAPRVPQAPSDILDRCAVCGSTDIRPWFTTDFGGIGRCAACGQVLRADRPVRDRIVHLHRTSAIHEAPYAALGHLAVSSLSFYDRFLDRCESVFPKGRLLDVGCGMGDFLGLAAERGFEVVAIEPVTECRRLAIERSGCTDILATPLEESVLPDSSVDAVAMWDVIEHLVNPRLALERAWRMLSPSGLLGVATINHASSMYDIYHALRHVAPPLARALTPRLFNPFHTYYFTMDSLAQLIESSGFDIVEHRGYEFPLERLEAGWPMKVGMRCLYAVQALLNRRGEQYVFARRRG